MEVEPVGATGFKGFQAEEFRSDFGKLLACGGGQGGRVHGVLRSGCRGIMRTIHTRFHGNSKCFVGGLAVHGRKG